MRLFRMALEVLEEQYLASSIWAHLARTGLLRLHSLPIFFALLAASSFCSCVHDVVYLLQLTSLFLLPLRFTVQVAQVFLIHALVLPISPGFHGVSPQFLQLLFVICESYQVVFLLT